MLGIVSITRDRVHRLVLQQPGSQSAHTLPPKSRQRIGRDLHRAAQLHELDYALGPLPQDGVTLRMRNDRGHSTISQL